MPIPGDIVITEPNSPGVTFSTDAAKPGASDFSMTGLMTSSSFFSGSWLVMLVTSDKGGAAPHPLLMSILTASARESFGCFCCRSATRWFNGSCTGVSLVCTDISPSTSTFLAGRKRQKVATWKCSDPSSVLPLPWEKCFRNVSSSRKRLRQSPSGFPACAPARSFRPASSGGRYSLDSCAMQRQSTRQKPEPASLALKKPCADLESRGSSRAQVLKGRNDITS
mmetsp:Transcript_33777/g.78460  ORF Transcript_33777/g.78460 Transcript_33777/m.78460 type:complete len:224 (-) Transcript_33777:232-903(-)